jgi:uncharacterized membrane protein (DUF373 family)
MQLENTVRRFEKLVIIILLALLGVVVIGAIIWFAIFLVKDFIMVTHGDLIVDLSNHMMHIFGFIFSIIIGLEIFETVKIYLEKHVFHAEMIILVAIIAIARKIIILDTTHINPQQIIAFAVLLTALGGCYFLVKWSKRLDKPNKKPKVKNNKTPTN